MHRATLSLPSIAVAVTKVSPIGNTLPDDTVTDSIATVPLSSVATGVGYVTTMPLSPGATVADWSSGHVIVGGVESIFD